MSQKSNDDTGEGLSRARSESKPSGWGKSLNQRCCVRTRRSFLAHLGVTAAGAALSGCAGSRLTTSARDTQRKSNLPNFIVIFVDDLGYADIQPFGNRYETNGTGGPHLYKLLRRAQRLHTVAGCSADRLLSGAR